MNPYFFPFEPYGIQLDMMNLIFDCLEKQKIGMIESPTGTGKTLSVLCATLCWLRSRGLGEELAEPDWICQQTPGLTSVETEFLLQLQNVRSKPVQNLVSTAESIDKSRKKQALGSGPKPDFANYKNILSEEAIALMEKSSSCTDPTRLTSEYKQDYKILYTSRTHSQLSQVCKELHKIRMPLKFKFKDSMATFQNKFCFEPIRCTTISSRKQSCINDRVKESIDLNENCFELLQTNSCPFWGDSVENIHNFSSFGMKSLSYPCDIEQLVEMGKSMNICPFFSCKSVANQAEVIFLPYSLIIDSDALKKIDIKLEECIVVIDEAHNIIDSINSQNSIQISLDELKTGFQHIKLYLEHRENRLSQKTKNNLVIIKSLLYRLISHLKNSDKGTHQVKVLTMLSSRGLDQINPFELCNFIKESNCLRNIYTFIKSLEQEKQNQSNSALLQIARFLIHLADADSDGKLFSIDSSRYEYMLLDPSYYFEHIVKKSLGLLLVGGTLSPIDYYKQTLFRRCEKSIATHSFPHIIKPNHIKFIPVDEYKGIPFSFTFKDRFSSQMIDNLATFLIKVIPLIPGGIVIFFQSYEYMDQIVKTWKQTVWDSLTKTCAVLIEDNNSDIFRQYQSEIHTSSKAVLFSVVGGKLSEGINFSDNLARCIIMVGIPFPNPYSAEWNAKTKYAEKTLGPGSASRLLNTVAMRAVNQSIGRSIRHAKDFAMILAVDSRYQKLEIQDLLPCWIKQSIYKTDSSSIMTAISAFFNQFDAYSL